jgi:lysophospholipase L1-like esterase
MILHSTTRLRLALPLLLLGLLTLPPSAEAKQPLPAPVEIGHVGVGTSVGGLTSILIPIHYPIELDGRLVETRVRLFDPGHGTLRKWTLHEALNSGRRHSPERRRGFTFVHRIGLDAELSRRVGDGLAVRVLSGAVADIDGDGIGDVGSIDEGAQPLPSAPRSGGLCSSVPQIRLSPGHRVSVPLPRCATKVKWTLRGRPEDGSARIRHDRLVYRAPRRFRGRAEVRLLGKPEGRPATSAAVGPAADADVRITVGTAGGVVVRALGDSVTAGFGYYSNGTPMTIGHLLECRPGEKEFDDACSSNSLNTTSKGSKVTYAPDYGLADNISWAAQWANEHGVTNYENLAVSGSDPADWAPKGELHEATEQIESEDPDYVLMTAGANPLLSEMLFGLDNMGCAIYSQIVGGYSECIERAFAEAHLREHLGALYGDLVRHTDATIYLMQYHLSVPSTAIAYSATQIAQMVQLLNREIASVAAEVNPRRLQVVSPPHFNVGIDVSPTFPSSYSCSRLGYRVDGPSVQSTPTQEELDVLHPLSFCEGPAGGGPPWVISGDTGIHPSAAGYAQMASQVPAPS